MQFRFGRNVGILLTLIGSIGTLESASLSQNQSDITIIRRLMAPLPPDSSNISFDPAQTYHFMELIRHALYGRKDADKFAQKAFRVAVQSDIRPHLGLAYMALIAHAGSTTALDSCLANANAIFESEKLPNLNILANLYAAPYYSQIGTNHARAFRLVNQFLANYRVKEHKQAYARAWNTLGEIYRSIRNNSKALECYRTSATYAFYNDYMAYPSPFINMGTIHKNSGNYDSAFFYFDMVLATDTSKAGMMYAYILNRKAQTYFLMKQLDTAYQHAAQSLSLYESIGSQIGSVLALSTLAQLEFALGRFTNCVEAGERALSISSTIEYYPQELLDAGQLIIDVYQKQGNYKKAYATQKIYTNIYSTLYGPDTNLQMLDEQLSLELRNETLENSLLEEKQRQTAAESANQRIILIIILATLLMAGIALAMLLKKNKMMVSVNKRLSAVIKENSGLISTIIHDLKSPLNSVKGFLSIIESETKGNEVVEESLQHSYRALQGGQEIIQQLVELRAIEEKSYRFNPESIEVQKLVDELKDDFDMAAKQKVIELTTQAQATTITTDKLLLRRALENLVSNAVKFSPKGKQVYITSWIEGQQAYFQVKDQGPGFDPSDMDRMYGKFQKLTAKPTGGESSHGLGLATVNLLIKELRGTILLETAVNEGACFTLEIPAIYPG